MVINTFIHFYYEQPFQLSKHIHTRILIFICYVAFLFIYLFGDIDPGLSRKVQGINL